MSQQNQNGVVIVGHVFRHDHEGHGNALEMGCLVDASAMEYARTAEWQPGVVGIFEVTDLRGTGLLPREAQEMVAATVLDGGRYHYVVDRYLSRYDESECGNARYPSADELEEAGVDTVALAKAVQSGLSFAQLGKAYKKGLDLVAFSKALAVGLNVEVFATALENGLKVADFGDTLAGMSVGEVNDALEMLNEHHAEVVAHPNPIERALHRLGECDGNC